MNFCKNCLQEYSEPQFNEDGKAICPVKNCGADHPENLSWPETINARNPSTSAAQLALLAQDPEAAARNPSAPAAVLALIAQDDTLKGA